MTTLEFFSSSFYPAAYIYPDPTPPVVCPKPGRNRCRWDIRNWCESSCDPGVGFILAWKHFRVIRSASSGYGLRMSVISVKAGTVRSHHLWMNQWTRKVDLA